MVRKDGVASNAEKKGSTGKAWENNDEKRRTGLENDKRVMETKTTTFGEGRKGLSIPESANTEK